MKDCLEQEFQTFQLPKDTQRSLKGMALHTMRLCNRILVYIAQPLVCLCVCVCVCVCVRVCVCVQQQYWRRSGRGAHCVFQLKGHITPVRTVVFSPDGLALASGGVGGLMNIWSLRVGTHTCRNP